MWTESCSITRRSPQFDIDEIVQLFFEAGRDHRGPKSSALPVLVLSCLPAGRDRYGG